MGVECLDRRGKLDTHVYKIDVLKLNRFCESLKCVMTKDTNILDHEKMKNIENEIWLRRIANYQMMHSSFCGELGLFYGKMGIAIFFFHYARYSNNIIYEDFAGELLDEIIEDIHDGMSVGFASGISGIGWGIEYLVQQKFIEGNNDEILEEIDLKILEYDLLRGVDKSLETGGVGIAYYVLQRLSSLQNRKGIFDDLYLHHLKQFCAQHQDSFRYLLREGQVDCIDVFGRELVTKYMIPDHDLSWKKGLRIII